MLKELFFYQWYPHLKYNVKEKQILQGNSQFHLHCLAILIAFLFPELAFL